MSEIDPGDILERAQAFMWTHARLLERHLFAHLFRGGPREPVIQALKAYQNPDGGFGHGLEPDKRSPESQPVDAETALALLDMVGFEEELVQKLCDWLMTVTRPEGGIPYALPSVRKYPRTPWWDSPDDPPASLNPTAGILGLLHKHGVRHEWVSVANFYCWKEIASTRTEEVHELAAILTFLEHAPDRARAEEALHRTGDRILDKGLVAMDPNDPGYVKKPLDWAPSPQKFCRSLFSDDVIEAHLDALAARQGEDGGWPIAWESVSPVAVAEWRGLTTVYTLCTLKAYGRLGF